MDETIKRLCEFLPPDLRQGIFNLLLECYDDAEKLAKDIGCSVSSVYEWSRENGKATPSDKHMLQILSLALKRCPNIKNLLKTRVVDEVRHLCTNLGLSEYTEKRSLNGLIGALDEKSREIIWCILRNRHAEISELSKLINASTDMDVLFRIKDVINPSAERVLGKPLLRFEECRIDPVSGEKTLFSWWLEEGISFIEEAEKPLIDVFDKGNRVRIVAEVPTSVEIIGSTCKNGILEVELKKSEKKGECDDRVIFN
jgi:hypothetical protein